MSLLILWASLWAGQADAPRELALLNSIKRNMRQNLQQVPNYTCLETIERSRRPSRSLVVARDGGPAPFRLHDVIRLEVAQVDRHELFSPPGARKFEEKDLSAFSNGGMFGNGVFALFAHEIFVSEGATPSVSSARRPSKAGSCSAMTTMSLT